MNILKYIFLIPVLLSTSVSAETRTDTLFVPALRLGVDMSGFARQLVETETLPIEFSADYEWRENFFAAAEAGWLNVDVNRETHRYRANGFFFRAGADFNILRGGEHNPNDVLILSLRYGFGKIEHEAPYILMHNAFWGGYETSVDAEDFLSHWLEAGIGMKTMIWNNLFLGWSLRGRVRVSSTSGATMDPYMISGFGKSNNAALTLHYSIYYRFPFH